MSSAVRRRQQTSAHSVDTSSDGDERVREERRAQTRGPSSAIRRPHWVAVVLFFTAMVVCSVHLHKCLPEPLSPNEDNSRFSELRAARILGELSRFGPKPAGSEACEGKTRGRILEELRSIQSSASPGVHFQIASQNPSGCFDIPKFDVDGFTICYRNVSNVIARLGRSDGRERVSILLNCHYDSWPTSSGGSDDLISCALMLELIRLLAQQPTKLQNDVIFLFNGAEESSLQAAHGFITQHPWRHSVRAFMNLEASGSGGRELLFQAGPANQWLLNAYLDAAVHPHCSVIGQEVFQSGVYPGDTDYRVFRDYGRVPGLDLAFVQNGYWWHTEFDESERITPGSLQRAGENVYSTLVHLLSSPYLEKPAEYGDKKSVFFDFLGLFVVVYPLSIAHALNIIVIVVAVSITIKGLMEQGQAYSYAIRNYVFVLISMIVATYCMTRLSSYWLGSLSWYSFHWLAVAVYGLPVIWVGATTQTFLTNAMSEKQKQDHSTAIENVHLSSISALLALFTYYDVASGFLFALMTLPILKKLIPTQKLAVWPSIAVHLIVCLPGLSMCVYTSEMLLSIFIPIMGRTSGNPEPVVASFVAFSAVAIVLAMLPLLSRSESVRDPSESGIRHYVGMLVGILMVVVLFLYVAGSAVGSPYRYNHAYPTTKRTQFMHTNRLFLNIDGSIRLNDTVIYAISHDFRGAEDIPFVNEENDYMKLVCAYDDPYCEIPFYYPTRDRIQERHIRFKHAAERPKLPNPSELRVIGKTTRGILTDYQMEVKGSGQISVYVVGQEMSRIVNCSISEPNKEKEDHLFLFLTCSGKDCGRWRFNVTVESPQQTPLLVGVASHYLHGPAMQSETIREMLRTIETQREKDHAWAITASAWNVDLVYQFV